MLSIKWGLQKKEKLKIFLKCNLQELLTWLMFFSSAGFDFYPKLPSVAVVCYVYAYYLASLSL